MRRLTLINDAKRKWHRLWSVRLSLFWAAVSGLAAAWPAAADKVPLSVYAGGMMVAFVVIAFARVTKQPGVAE
jgi:hypothetical protein